MKLTSDWLMFHAINSRSVFFNFSVIIKTPKRCLKVVVKLKTLIMDADVGVCND